VAEALIFPGRIQYSLDGFAKVGTPLVGIVKTVRGRLGEKVRAGQVLVTIESADIGMAYSDFAKAESDLQLTQRYLELAHDLYRVKSLSKKEFDQAQNDSNKAQAEYNRSRQRLLTLKVPPSELDKPARERQVSTRFELKSPLSGVIVDKTVTVGQVVGQDPAQTLFTVADLEVLQVVAEIYERDLRFVQAGMSASVTVESVPDHVFPARVVHVGEVVDPMTRTIKVRCDVTNLEYKLKPEMFARVHVHLTAPMTAVMLPRRAVVRMGNQAFVFVEHNETEFERRVVTTGPVAEDTIEIRHGVKDGDHVVTRGTVLLKGALEKRLEHHETEAVESLD
jgi:cobalt-zinc-cadmium efflux system membrane fusion protein